MWEYKRMNYKFRFSNELIEKLNIEGNEGWEIIHYEEFKPELYGCEYEVKILFKRLIKESICVQREMQ